MDKKDRYGRDRRFSGPVDRDNGRREKEGPVSNKERVMVYDYAVGYTIILRGHGKATPPPPYTEMTEPPSLLLLLLLLPLLSSNPWSNQEP